MKYVVERLVGEEWVSDGILRDSPIYDPPEQLEVDGAETHFHRVEALTPVASVAVYRVKQ